METPGLLRGWLGGAHWRAPETFSCSIGVRTDNSVAVAGAAAAAMARAEIGGGAGAL